MVVTINCDNDDSSESHDCKTLAAVLHRRTVRRGVGNTHSCCLQVPSGVLADLWGRKATLVVGASCSLAAHVVLFGATGWMGDYLDQDERDDLSSSESVGVNNASQFGDDHTVSSQWTPWALLCLRSLLIAAAEALQSGTDDALLYDVVLEEAQLVAADRQSSSSSPSLPSPSTGTTTTASALRLVDDAFKKATSSKSMMWPLGAAVASVLSGLLLSETGSRRPPGG